MPFLEPKYKGKGRRDGEKRRRREESAGIEARPVYRLVKGLGYRLAPRAGKEGQEGGEEIRKHENDRDAFCSRGTSVMCQQISEKQDYVRRVNLRIMLLRET